MHFRGHRYVVDWGHLAFITLLGGGVFFYLLDTRAVSLKINNILLVQPLSLFALVLYALIVPQCFRRADAEPVPETLLDDPLAPTLPKERIALIKIGLLGLSLGVFVFVLNTIGFDIAIWAFALATMLICGERRPVPLLVYPLAVSLVAVYGFRALMPYPMVTTIL